MSAEDAKARVLDFAVRPEERLGASRVGIARKGEARAFALMVLRDPAYQQRVMQMARAGTLPPAIWALLYHYGYGKPVEHVELGRHGDFEDLESASTEELLARTKELEVVLNAAIAASPTGVSEQ